MRRLKRTAGPPAVVGIAAMAAMTAMAAPAEGQYAERPAPRFEAPMRVVSAPALGGGAGLATGLLQDPTDPTDPPGFGAAFTVETLGGFAGSLAGLGIGIAIVGTEGCGEDIKCLLERVAGALTISATGAAGGAYGAGKLRGTDPSGWGAIVGSVGGVIAGLAVDHLVAEDLDLTRDGTVRLLTYGATHAITTALGSRIGAALR